jgi:ribosomal-protein-alanine N-acetyltransferase
MPIITTHRLILRSFTDADGKALKRIIADPTSMRLWPAPDQAEGVTEWIERSRASFKLDGHGCLAVILQSDGRCIGDCGILRQSVEGEVLTVIRWTIQAPHWERGFAVEAATAMRDAVFARHPLERLHACIAWDHVAAQRIAERIGMTRISEFNHAANNQTRTFVYMVGRNSCPPS